MLLNNATKSVNKWTISCKKRSYYLNWRLKRWKTVKFYKRKSSKNRTKIVKKSLPTSKGTQNLTYFTAPNKTRSNRGNKYIHRNQRLTTHNINLIELLPRPYEATRCKQKTPAEKVSQRTKKKFQWSMIIISGSFYVKKAFGNLREILWFNIKIS